MKIEKMLVVSTAHIKPEDDDWLRKESTFAKDLAYGWLIVVTPLDYFKDYVELPKNIDRLVYYAHGLGCEWLLLDNAEEPSEDLPQFEWD